MNFLRSSRGRNKKASFDKSKLNFDLLYQLAYMSAVATTGIPRDQLFYFAANLPCTTAHYFGEVYRLAGELKYRFSEACQVVGENADAPEIKGLLLRMSSFLASGEPEENFLERESKLQADTFQNLYDSELESLKKWTDAFAALAVSSALIVVVATISTVIFDLGTNFVMGLIVIMLGVNCGGVWVLSRASPKEDKVMAGEMSYYSQRSSRQLLFTLGPAVLLIGMLGLAQGTNLGPLCVLCGLLLFPVGFASSRLDGRITKQDKDIGIFLRILGSTSSAIGTTPGNAIDRLDMRSVPAIAPMVMRLHTRLRARLRPELRWDRLVEESGSEIVRRSIMIFTEGIRLGGDAEKVGLRASMLSSQVDFLRAKRRQVSSTFGWLSIAMHACIVFLLIFVMEIVGGFGNLVDSAGISDISQTAGAASSAALSFNFGNMALLQRLTPMVILMLSIINALAPNVTDGGYKHRFFHFFSLTLITSGIGIMLGPLLGSWIFSAAQRVSPAVGGG